MYQPVIQFAYGLAQSARIFTLQQVARHPLISQRTQPVKRASEVLRLVAGDFERLPGLYGEPHRFRLTTAAKKRLGLNYRNVSNTSQKVKHWLALGDVYTVLRLNGGVQAWKAEPKYSADFDIFMAYGGRAFLVEVQRTPITSKVWSAKWRNRMEFLSNAAKLKSAPWQPVTRVIRPTPVLVDLTGQQDSTVGVPEGVIVSKTLNELPTVLQRYINRTRT